MADLEIFIKTWDLYFANEEFTIFNKEVSQIIEIRKCIKLSDDEIAAIVRNEIYWCSYGRYLKMNSPSEMKCISCAVSEIILERKSEKIFVETRIEGCEIEREFLKINSDNVGGLVGVLGTVCRVGYRRIENTRGVFECVKCSRIVKTTIRNNVYRPGTCGGCKGKLIFLEEHLGNRCVDTQEIRIQEMTGEGANRACVDIELQGGLVGMVAPGDVVEVIGIVKAEKVDDAYKLKIAANNISKMGEKEKARAGYKEDVYIEEELQKTRSELEKTVEFVTIGESESEMKREESETEMKINGNFFNLKNVDELDIESEIESNENEINSKTKNKVASISSNNSPLCKSISVRSTNKTKSDINQDNFELFREISEEASLIDILAEAFYGSVVGHKKIKEALVLALFGGGDAVRSEIHVLVIGDPGLGKSRILLAASSVLPKSVYVSGNFCTAAGLTVSIIHDPGSGEYMADAGALIVSDGGVCCIDEFDKIDDHTALFEVMEDQVVTVAKGGVVCSIATHPTILAAANPRYGHFDSTKSVRENIRFDPALLSRFDLVFLLVDNTGEKEDRDVFQKLLCGDENCIRTDTKYSYRTLVQYVEYARAAVVPILSRRAHVRLREYYLSIRHYRNVTIRCLEALRRLTEAHARLELRPVAAEKHADRAIRLYDSALLKEEASRQKKTNIEDALRDYVSIKGQFISKEELLEIVKLGAPSRRPEELVEILNCKGVIISICKNKYKICLK